MARPPDKPEALDETAQRAEKKRFSTLCGHIKRKLKRGEPLHGELLEIALDLAGANAEDSAATNVAIVTKLNAGQPLHGYELHLMIDVFLLHARLG